MNNQIYFGTPKFTEKPCRPQENNRKNNATLMRIRER